MKTISVESLSIISFSNIPVVTTELLASLYGTEPDYIRKNFNRNSGRFVIGKHYFLLENEELREFKHSMSLRPSVKIARNVRSLILWTERGAARHAKMLETDQAWEVFEKLEDCYFSQGKTTQTEQQSHIQPQFTAEEIILLCYMQLWMEKAQQLSKQLYPVMRELNSDYYGKLFDLAYETRHITNRTRDTLLREAAKLDPANYMVHRARSMLAQLRARQFEF
ncbi:TPA: ORF6N domain-containing protein [Escherichia coli]|uniref:ORF6N domain-containing protein n=1 Tax=Escherichia coli TaxID=562 RepID=UPI000699DFBD|nr:ORF6N domain-containing protein [Escherichia coli]EEY4453865.1 ORF6N domain-containing protein [Escherichia coli O130]EEU2827822.1 ORF6N domain-containing protein [Escherichia coli]EEV2142264.1 ORF6N domain-containing protein [Escherichia coli]EEY4419868.1 ORF6N domain-containing protein [Escherichia coli]EEY5465367.1 ORF6N domain-containing protein [Escherichia coli]